MSNGKKRDPIFGAAVLKLTFLQRKEEQSPQFQEIYEGVLRDLKLTDEQVETYLQTHRDEVEAAIRAKSRGSTGGAARSSDSRLDNQDDG